MIVTLRCSDAHDDEDGTVKIKIIEQKTGPLFKEDLNSEVSDQINNFWIKENVETNMILHLYFFK